MNFFGQRILIVQAVTVLVASLGLAAAAFLVADRTEQHTSSTTRYSDAAINAALIQSQVNELIALGSEDLVRALVASQGESLSTLPIPTIIRVRSLLVDSAQRAAAINTLIGGQTGANIDAAADSALRSIDAFYASPNAETFTAFSQRIIVLRDQAAAITPTLDASAGSSLDSLSAMTSRTRWLLVLAALASGSIITATTVLLGQRLAQSHDQLRRERDTLIETSIVMDRRNKQFRALYQVVTEVSESLSTRYVVKTAVKEARPLVGADLVVLRLLRSNELVIAGMDAAEGLDISMLGPLPLGTGFAGRSAKRGKTIHVTADAQDEMSEVEGELAVQSGIIVPLIIGARVVGTMSCWSIEPKHFTEDDERILEMMASHVASAVAAADSFEVSEQNAHLDALTGLANRRQLSEDVSGYFAGKTRRKESHTIAMIDIDNFGLFNKDFGHRIGDITLQKVAHVLKTTLREDDRVYRYGGEEFLAVINCPMSEALQVAEHLRRAVAETPLTGEQMEPIGPITISVGIASYPDDGDGYEVVTERADQALRASKQLGRNRVTIWTPDLNLEAVA